MTHTDPTPPERCPGCGAREIYVTARWHVIFHCGSMWHLDRRVWTVHCEAGWAWAAQHRPLVAELEHQFKQRGLAIVLTQEYIAKLEAKLEASRPLVAELVAAARLARYYSARQLAIDLANGNDLIASSTQDELDKIDAILAKVEGVTP